MLVRPNQFREKIYFLRLIPDPVYFNLHFEEFYLPDEALNRLREACEAEWHCYLMSYKVNDSNPARHDALELCRVIHAAQLIDTQVKKIKQIEKVFENKVALVAYQKSLVFR